MDYFSQLLLLSMDNYMRYIVIQIEVNVVGLLLHCDHKYSSSASQCGVTCGTLSPY